MGRTVVYFLLSLAVCYSKRLPECSSEIGDECVKPMVFINIEGNNTLPKNRQEIEEFCRKAYDAKECSEDFIKKCLKGLPRQLAGTWITSVLNALDGWCEPSRIDELVEATSCLVEQEEPMKYCMLDLIGALDSIATLVDPDDQLAQSCCLLDDFKNCVKSASAECSEDAIYFAEGLIDAYSSDAIQLACSGYEVGSKRCNELPEIEKVNRTSKSIFGPLISIILTL